jgi:GT2 family glycosyltransferase
MTRRSPAVVEGGSLMARFSVVMPVYNHQGYVAEAIRSVQQQTLDDWELVVVNDGSTDRSGAIIDDLARHDPRIVVHHQANAGPSKSRNTAARLARGQWLTYLDSDDVWDARALEHFARALAQRPRARFLYGYYHRLQDGRIVPLEGSRQDRPTGTADLFLRMFLNPMCICHLRDLWQQSGGFDESLRCCEDYDLYLRMSLLCSFEPINRLIGYRRRHGRNISRQTGRSQQTEAEVLRRFAATQGKIAGLDGAAVTKRLASLHYRASRQFLKEKRFHDARKEALEALHYRPSMKARAVSWASWLLGPLSQAG